MFIINLTYKTATETIDQHLEAHVAFLNEQYALKNFLASGRKVPRTGGIILSNLNSRTALEQLLEKDPFKIHQLADYEIIEFVPSKMVDELQFLMEN